MKLGLSKALLIFFWIVGLSFFSCKKSNELHPVKLVGQVFGTEFHITYYDTDQRDLTKEVEVSKSNKEIAKANTKIEEKIIKAGDTRVRDIKDQELSTKIKKELSENNIGKATQLANQAAKSAGAMSLEPSKRVSAEEFRSGYEEQLARLIETYKPVVDGKRIPFGAYMQKNLKRRYGQR